MIKGWHWFNVFSIKQRRKCSKVGIGSMFSVLNKGVNDQRLVLVQCFKY